VELVEDLRGYVVKLPRYSKYAPGAEELCDHDRNPGMAHLTDEGSGLGGGGPEAGSQVDRSEREILGAGRMIQIPHSSVPTPASPFPPSGSVFQ